MVATRTAVAQSSHSLLEALVHRDTRQAHRLLQSSTVGPGSHAGPCGFTTLHAAVLGRCAAALPALVAAGAPLDVTLHSWPWQPLEALLEGFGMKDCPRARKLRNRTTALILAVQCVAPPARPPARL
jgi:hypothetical protein